MKSISAVIDELTDYFRKVDADGLAGANYICASFIKNPCDAPLGSYLRICVYKDDENLFNYFTRFEKVVADHEQ